MNIKYLDTLECLLACHHFHGQAPRPLTKYGRRHVWYGKPLQLVAEAFEKIGIQICFKPKSTDWPYIADCMMDPENIRAIRNAIISVTERNIRGAFVECGVWRGGGTVYAKACVNETGYSRDVYGCDSFDGLPKAGTGDCKDDKHHTYSALAVSLDEVEQRAAKYNVGHIKWVEGFFEDSLPKFPDLPIAVLRCDGDMYSSTMHILTNLYPKVSKGGIVIMDDFGVLQCCRNAFYDYMGGDSVTLETISSSGSVRFIKP